MSSRRDCSSAMLDPRSGRLEDRKLTDTQMGVDASITGSACQVLVLTVWDMEVGFGITVLLGQTKVDHVDLVSTLADTHQKVVGLNITVDERLGVDVLDTRDELVCQEKDRLQREFAVAKVEQILQTRTQKVQNHGVVVTFGSIPTDEWNADSSREGLVDTGFILELWVLSLNALELDGDLFTRDDVGAWGRQSVDCPFDTRLG